MVNATLLVEFLQKCLSKSVRLTLLKVLFIWRDFRHQDTIIIVMTSVKDVRNLRAFPPSY